MPVLMKGYIKVQSNGLDGAIDTYIDAVDKAPGFVPLYCLLGDIYSSLGQFENAITEYKMAIWLDSLNIPAYRHLCSTPPVSSASMQNSPYTLLHALRLHAFHQWI